MKRTGHCGKFTGGTESWSIQSLTILSSLTPWCNQHSPEKENQEHFEPDNPVLTEWHSGHPPPPPLFLLPLRFCWFHTSMTPQQCLGSHAKTPGDFKVLSLPTIQGWFLFFVVKFAFWVSVSHGAESPKPLRASSYSGTLILANLAPENVPGSKQSHDFRGLSVSAQKGFFFFKTRFVYF